VATADSVTHATALREAGADEILLAAAMVGKKLTRMVMGLLDTASLSRF